MVSLDDPEKNKAFAESLDAKLVLLSDPTGVNATAYGVRAFGGVYARRWTFYIDGEGTIRAIDKDVRVDSAGQDIAKKLGELGFPKRGMMTPSRAPSMRGLVPDGRRPGSIFHRLSAICAPILPVQVKWFSRIRGQWTEPGGT